MLYSQQSNGGAEALAPALETATSTLLASIIHQLDEEAALWYETLAVSIGRAVAITGLKESQIRYFEELGALQPAKTTGQAGATRLYTVADLRRLRALALLVQCGQRPAEAAALVKTNDTLVETGLPLVFTSLAQRERSAVADGFILARLVDQLIEAVQAELDVQFGGSRDDPFHIPETLQDVRRSARVVEVLLPMHPFGDPQPTRDALYAQVRSLRAQSARTLVAIKETNSAAENAFHSTVFQEAGSDERTVLFYSTDSWELPQRSDCQYTLYRPVGRPDTPLIVLIEADGQCIPPLFQVATESRAKVLERILVLCAQLYGDFSRVASHRSYRYRSDGFPLVQTREDYSALLEYIQHVIFPDDEAAMAVLLIPNSLDHPQLLSILASSGYPPELARQARIRLNGEGEGLSGRAYRLREPFLSRNAAKDPRVAYAIEERCEVALAVPLTTSWGIAPFGVLYLASQTEGQKLHSDVAYVGLVLGGILSELLGRWWLTRLRKEQDVLLHHGLATMTQWLDSLDQRGPGFQQGVRVLATLWERFHRRARRAARGGVALAVLDIDRYEQIQMKRTALFPVAAQTHVHRAIRSIADGATPYWFSNDHALVILEDVDSQQAHAIMRRIAEQVATRPLKTRQRGVRPTTMSITYALRAMTYEALHDLGGADGQQLESQVADIIDHLRDEIRYERAARGSVAPVPIRPDDPPRRLREWARRAHSAYRARRDKIEIS